MTKFSKGSLAAAKLTPSQVMEMRELYNERWTQGALARRYGISVVQVGRIVRGESWQQYPQPPHPDEIEHSKAIAPQAPEVTLTQESVDKLMKELALINDSQPPTAADPLDAYLNKGKEGS
jgi:hypothetical protein